MPRLDAIHHPQTGVSDRKRHHGFVGRKFPAAERRLHRDDVVERREAEPAPGEQPQAVVLGMAVNRGEEPEDDLRPEEAAAVLLRNDRTFEQSQEPDHPGSPVQLVLSACRDPERLGEVLVGDPQEPAVVRPAPVETLDHQDPSLTEVRDAGRGHLQPERRRQAQAEELVFNAAAEVHPHQRADLGLQDVGRRRESVRELPPAVREEQGRLALRTRERDAKARADSEGTPVQLRNQPGHLGIRNRRRPDGARWAGILALRDKGHRARRTAAEVREQGERVGVRSIHARGQPGAHAFGVRQQVVEESEYRLSPVAGRVQRQGERNRRGALPGEPVGVVSEGEPGRRPRQRPETPPVLEEVESPAGKPHAARPAFIRDGLVRRAPTRGPGARSPGRAPREAGTPSPVGSPARRSRRPRRWLAAARTPPPVRLGSCPAAGGATESPDRGRVDWWRRDPWSFVCDTQYRI